MPIAELLALIAKGITVASSLLEAGQSAAPALEALKDLVTGARKGPVTQEELDKTEAVLDALIEKFNEPLPPE